MGWNPFKTEYKTHVGTLVSRIVDDAQITSSVKIGLGRALRNESDIPSTVANQLIGSIGFKAESAYRYAEANYTYGMPSGEIYSSTQGSQQVEAVIEALEGQQVLMEYSHYGAPNALHIGWLKLFRDYGYNAQTNELVTLSTQKGRTVYLWDMVVVVPSSMTDVDHIRIDRWGIPPNAGTAPGRRVEGLSNYVKHNSIEYSNSATDIYIKVTYKWNTGTFGTPAYDYEVEPIIGVGTLNLTIGEYLKTDDYFQARYTVNSQTKIFMYKDDSGTYPSLDAIFKLNEPTAGSYFPFAYFRFGKQNMTTNTSTEAYKTTEKYLKFLSIDFKTVADAVNSNPDIGDVEQAFLMFGVPAVSTNNMENKYLYDYFNNLYSAIGGSNMPLSAWQVYAAEAHATVIADKLFKMVLNNKGICKRLVAKNIGGIGTYTSSFSTKNITKFYGFNTQISEHTYRKQISTGVCEEIIVYGLNMRYYVSGENYSTGDETDSILLIPIDRLVTQGYPSKDREILYSRSMHLVFNSMVIQKIKWYQQDWFADLITIIGVVTIVATAGANSWIATTIGVTGATAVVVSIIFDLVVAAGLPEVFKTVVKVFGEDFAKVVAAAVILYGGYRLAKDGKAFLKIPWAKHLLTVSLGLQQAVLQENFNDLLDERNELDKYIEDQTKLLDRAQELLGSKNVLAPYIVFGEKPEDFYNRAIHSGNIGVLGIEAVSSYVDMALTLPKSSDTLGEPIYGY